MKEIVERLAQQNIDGLILDIRGGYGGAWTEHLQPFFVDNAGFFEAEILDGEDKLQILPADEHHNPQAYTGPMAVLINEGVRSGKEAMAYQFKKSRRATLIGSKTAGYFFCGIFQFYE